MNALRLTREHETVLHWVFCAVVVVSIALNVSSFSGAVALLILCGARIADRYFHDSFHDVNRVEIGKVQAETAVLKDKLSKIELKAALGGR